jgi:hypothetical protein
MTVGDLLNSLAAGKEAATENNDVDRAAALRGLERRLRNLIKSFIDVVERDQDPPSDEGDEARPS